MEKPNLFVYRSVSRESLAEIEDARKIITDQPTGVAIEDPHLTVIGNRYIQQRAKAMSMFTLDKIVTPMPEIGTQILTLPISGVKVIENETKGLMYAIELQDPEGTFEAEREIFVRRALGRLGLAEGYFTNPPHVTLGFIDPRYANDTTVETVAAQLPETVSFRPTHVPNYRHHLGKAPAPKMIVPGGIPNAFLKSLSGAKRENT